MTLFFCFGDIYFIQQSFVAKNHHKQDESKNTLWSIKAHYIHADFLNFHV